MKNLTGSSFFSRGRLLTQLAVQVLLISLLFGCVHTLPVYNPNFPVQSTSYGKVRNAIVRSLNDRHWVVRYDNPAVFQEVVTGSVAAGNLVTTKKLVKPPRMEARFCKTAHCAVITITYSGSSVSIKLKSSSDLNQGFSKTGQEVIHKTYLGWVRTLEKDIQKNINQLRR